MPQRKIRIGIFASSHSLIERVQVLAARQHDQIFINTQGLDDAIVSLAAFLKPKRCRNDYQSARHRPTAA